MKTKVRALKLNNGQLILKTHLALKWMRWSPNRHQELELLLARA
jgi:hypothetical protein